MCSAQGLVHMCSTRYAAAIMELLSVTECFLTLLSVRESSCLNKRYAASLLKMQPRAIPTCDC